MEESLKNLMQDLGNAINDSLSESERIAEAIGEIKRAGFDVFLVLEANIGFNKRDEPVVDFSEEETEEVSEATPAESQGTAVTKYEHFTPKDQKFLKAFHITANEE